MAMLIFRKPLVSVVAVLGLFVMLSVAHATSAGPEGASFLDIPVGAGPAALGSAYSASATDAYATVYNPAGLGFLNSTQVAAQHLSYLESMNYEFGSVVVPLKAFGALGVSIQYLGTGDIDATNPDASSAGHYSSYYAAYSLAYGHTLTDRFSVGVTGKAIQGKLADVSATAFAADFGTLFQVNENLALAATLTNLGTDLTFEDQKDSLPLAFHLGGRYKLLSHLKTSVEGVYDKTEQVMGRFGVEWNPIQALSLRAGYRSDTASHNSSIAGLSTGLGLHWWGQEFAYAWLPYGDLGDTQYFSFLLKFGEPASSNLSAKDKSL